MFSETSREMETNNIITGNISRTKKLEGTSSIRSLRNDGTKELSASINDDDECVKPQRSTAESRWIRSPPLTGHRRPQVVAPETLRDKSTKKEPDSGDVIGPRECSRDAVYYTYVPCIHRNAAANITPGVTRSRLRLTSVVNRTPIGTYSRSMLCSCESSSSFSWILSAGRRDAARRPPKINAKLNEMHVALHESSSCSSWLLLWLFFVIVIIMIVLCMCVMCWRIFYRRMPHGYFLHLFLFLLLGLLKVIPSDFFNNTSIHRHTKELFYKYFMNLINKTAISKYRRDKFKLDLKINALCNNPLKIIIPVPQNNNNNKIRNQWVCWAFTLTLYNTKNINNNQSISYVSFL